MSKYDAIRRNREIGSLRVSWYLTRQCNYECSYCSDLFHVKKYPSPSLEKLQTAARNLFDNVDPGKLYIDFVGGEPTTVKSFIPYSKWLKEQGVKFQTLITNGSPSAKYFKRLEDTLDHISLSYHFEMVDDDDKMIEKLKEIHNMNFSFIVVIMAHAVHFERCKKVVAALKEVGITFNIYKIRHLGNTPNFNEEVNDYEEDIDKWITDSIDMSFSNKSPIAVGLVDGVVEDIKTGNDIRISNNNMFKDYWCYIGIDSINVWYDGRIERGTCKVGGDIGNIFEPFELPLMPIQCTKGACWCAPELLVRKARSTEFIDFVEL